MGVLSKPSDDDTDVVERRTLEVEPATLDRDVSSLVRSGVSPASTRSVSHPGRRWTGSHRYVAIARWAQCDSGPLQALPEGLGAEPEVNSCSSSSR
jgi:hypothetical protein